MGRTFAIVVSLLIIIVGAGWMYHDHVIFWPDQPTEGVVDTMQVQHGQGRTLYNVDIRYTYAANGKDVAGRYTSVSTHPSTLTTGEAVTMLYATGPLHTARIAPFTVVWATSTVTLSTIVFGIGVGALVLSGLAAWLLRP